MPNDLDMRDLEEVRRRVVLPVVSSLVRPDELEEVEVVILAPSTVWPDQSSELFQIRFRARGAWISPGQCWPMSDGLWDAEWLAADVYGALQDEIAESRFAWGELREGHYEIPPPLEAR